MSCDGSNLAVAAELVGGIVLRVAKAAGDRRMLLCSHILRRQGNHLVLEQGLGDGLVQLGDALGLGVLVEAPLDGGDPSLILPDIAPVGYHAWIDPRTISAMWLAV